MSRALLAAAFQVALWLLPRGLANVARRSFLGWKLAPDSRIGFSIIHAGEVELGPNARIGHFNVIRNVDRLKIGRNSSLGNFNRISGSPYKDLYLVEMPRRSDFIVGDESAVTHRHFFDCAQSISIGDFVTIAGMQSQFWTHGIDIEICHQRADPIMIGNYCMVGSQVVVLKSITMGTGTVLGAGSVLTRSTPDFVLCVGSPAKVIKELSRDAGYFTRTIGPVS